MGGAERYGVFPRDSAFLRWRSLPPPSGDGDPRLPERLCPVNPADALHLTAEGGGERCVSASSLCRRAECGRAGGVAVQTVARRCAPQLRRHCVAHGRLGVGLLEPHRWLVFGFFTLYFLMFLGAACFYSLIRKQPTADEDLALVFADAFVYLAAGLAVLHGGLGNSPGVFPAALGVFLLLMAWDTLSAAPGNAPLRRALLGLALTSLTVAIPVQMRQGWVAIAWSVGSRPRSWRNGSEAGRQWAGRVVWRRRHRYRCGV